MKKLTPFGQDIWIANGDELSIIGFQYPTRMAVIRLSDGTLFIWSPITLTEDLRSDVEALGTVRYIIAPNSLHHVFLKDWTTQYPDAKVYAPPGLRQKRQDINFDHDLENTPPLHWATDIDQVLVHGNIITTEVIFFHNKSGTVLFTDLIQQHLANQYSGWRALIARLDLLSAPEPSVPRKFRMAFTNRRAARKALQYILAWSIEKVVMAHGPLIEKEGHTVISRAFLWLKM